MTPEVTVYIRNGDKYLQSCGNWGSAETARLFPDAVVAVHFCESMGMENYQVVLRDTAGRESLVVDHHCKSRTHLFRANS